MRGKTVCYHHGGMTPTGFGLPQTVTGKYSRVLPVQLAARYAEALANPDLLSLKHDLAVIEARLTEHFQRLETGESGQVWRALRDALQIFEAALATGDRQVMHGALDALRTLITRGTSDYAAWNDIHKTWASRCRLTETEHRTLLMAQSVVTVEQLNAYLGVVTHALQQQILAHTDAQTAQTILGAVGGELRRLVALGDRGYLGPVAQA